MGGSGQGRPSKVWSRTLINLTGYIYTEGQEPAGLHLAANH